MGVGAEVVVPRLRELWRIIVLDTDGDDGVGGGVYIPFACPGGLVSGLVSN